MGKAENVDENIVTENRLPGKSLEQVSTTFIKPATATPGEKEWLPLSTLDILFAAFYTPILCTFELTGEEQSKAAVQHLKESLADALVLFYPLAGRVVKTGGPPRIHCNDAGAVFTEASVDADLAQLRTDDDFQPQPLLSGLAAAGLADYPTLPQTDAGLPALIIQVTHFKCGGITLVVNWAHAVADAQAGFHFLRSWTELARGLEVSLLPDHRRGELVKPRESDRLYTLNPLIDAAVLSPGAQTIKKNSKLNSAAEKADSTTKQATIIPKTIEFTDADIAKLKQQALEQQPGQILSRADCLSTHLLRAIARAQNLQPDSTSTVRLLLLVEGRKKLSLPPGFFGNVISMLSVITTVDELLNHFGASASLIHSAVGSLTADWFQDLVDFVSLIVAGKVPGPSMDDPAFPSMTSVGISYLHRYCFYELDFGFGVPVHSTRNTMAARDGLFFVLPSSRGKDHLTVLANIDADVMPNFLSMAHDI